NLRSLFANSDEVTPEEFVAASRDIRTRRPDIQAIEWVPAVPAADRLAVERFGKARLSPDFAFRDYLPDGRFIAVPPREVYYPILYIYPLEGNEVALGYDLSKAVNRPDLDLAIKSRSLTMTGKIHLVQSGPNATVSSLIMVCPVYHPDEKG